MKPIKTIFCLLILFSLLSTTIPTVVFASSEIWSQTYGGEPDDEAVAILKTNVEEYLIAGTTHSFGAGGADFWLFKINESGDMLWNRTYGGSENDFAQAMIPTNDGGYLITGETNSFGAGSSDCWLIKLDYSGTIQWNKTYGEATQDGTYSVIQTNDGGFALAGYTTVSNASKDVWLVKTDSSGNMLWNQTYGGIGNDFATSVIQTVDGGYALLGDTSSFGESIYRTYCWLIKTDFNGNMEWNKIFKDKNEDSKSYPAKTLIQANDGGYTFVASPGFIIGLRDIWLAHVDSQGNMIWSVTCVKGGPSIASSLIKTTDGGYAVSGYTSSMGNFPGTYSYLHLIKVNSNGSLSWGKNFDGLGDNHDLFVVETDDGGYAVADTTKSRDEGAHNQIWFTKVDFNGDIIPEFSSWMLLPLFLIISIVVLVSRNYLRKKLLTEKTV